MSNKQKTSRRGFITAALSGTAALAGCNTKGTTQAQTTQTEEETAKLTTKEKQPTASEKETASQKDEFSEEELEEALKALTYDLSEDLAHEGFDPESQRAELIGEDGDNAKLTDDGEYRIHISLDTDSLLHGSGLLVGDQDLYTAARVGAMYDIFEDGQRQLNETTAIVSQRLEEFSENIEMPEDYELGIHVNFEGARGSSTSFGFEYGEETVEEATEEFLAETKADDQKGDGHRVGYHPMKYDNLTLLEEGDSLTFHIDNGETSEEHTIEYDGGNQILVNGDEYTPREEDGMIRTQVLGEEIRVNQFNPLYLQESGELPEAVELEFEHASPNY